MKQFTTTTGVVALAGLVSSVSAHGFVTSPQARMPGSAMAAACGQQVEINQESDNYGNIQGELQVAASQSDYDADACDIWLCKGYKYADNTDNVQSYTAGQVVPFTVDIRAPHTGVANVSVVDTATNTVISGPLISWDVYASTETGVSANDTSFSVTIPSDLGSQCETAGACVLQWYWYAESIDQTYESCVDFTVGGSSSSSSGSTSSGSSSAAAVASSSAAATPVTLAAAGSSTPVASPSTLQTVVRSSSVPAASAVVSTPATTTAAASTASTAFPDGKSAADLVAWLDWLSEYFQADEE